MTQWPKLDGDDYRGQPVTGRTPVAGHIDGANPPKGGWVGGTQLVASTYLFGAKHGGGGTCYWPGSHHAVQRYMNANPARSKAGDFPNSWSCSGGAAAAAAAGIELAAYGYPATAPVENTMPAGSVAFAHGLLVHMAMPNRSSGTVRVGIFARWHHSRAAAMRQDVPRPLWEYWEGDAIVESVERSRARRDAARL